MGIGRRSLAESIAAILLASAPSIALAEKLPPDQHIYENQDYGFSVELPHGLPACVTTPPGSNHGVNIALDPAADCEGTDDARPMVTLYAEYNVPYDVKTPLELAKIECAYDKPRHVKYLRHLKFAKQKAAACRVERADGGMEYEIFAFRDTEPATAGWVIVSADLITTKSRYAADFAQFQAVLRTVNMAYPIDPPYPSKSD